MGIVEDRASARLRPCLFCLTTLEPPSPSPVTVSDYRHGCQHRRRSVWNSEGDAWRAPKVGGAEWGEVW